MSANRNLLILPGDGIGPEVTAQALRIVDWLAANRSLGFDVTRGLIGGAAYDATGTPFPDDTLAAAKVSDAVLLGAVGGPKWDDLDFTLKPERGLLGLRKELGLFANLRPAVVFGPLAGASSLKPELIAGLDIMIVRELTGGIYFGEPRGIETLADGSRVGINTEVYSTAEIRRVGRVAFELARKRNKLVHSFDKANVMESGILWREEIQALHDADYPDVELRHMYADNAAMQLVRQPRQFDVMVTTNLFGDILSDCAAMLTGSLGMLPSASLGETDGQGLSQGLYEPVHGSAPDIAGQGLANPLAMIQSLAMLLRYSLGAAEEADLIGQAVGAVLESGLRTADIMQPDATQASTAMMGDAVIAELDKLAR